MSRSVWEGRRYVDGSVEMWRWLNGSTQLRINQCAHGRALLYLRQGIWNADVKLDWEVPMNASDAYLKRAAMSVAKSYVRLLRDAGL